MTRRVGKNPGCGPFQLKHRPQPQLLFWEQYEKQWETMNVQAITWIPFPSFTTFPSTIADKNKMRRFSARFVHRQYSVQTLWKRYSSWDLSSIIATTALLHSSQDIDEIRRQSATVIIHRSSQAYHYASIFFNTIHLIESKFPAISKQNFPKTYESQCWFPGVLKRILYINTSNVAIIHKVFYTFPVTRSTARKDFGLLFQGGDMISLISLTSGAHKITIVLLLGLSIWLDPW